MCEFIDKVRKILDTEFGIGIDTGHDIVGLHQQLFNCPWADYIFRATYVVRKDGVLIKEGPETLGVIYLPRESTSYQHFHIYWWYEAVLTHISSMDKLLMRYWGAGHMRTMRSIVIYKSKSRIGDTTLWKVLMIPCEIFLRDHLRSTSGIYLVGSGRVRSDGCVDAI